MVFKLYFRVLVSGLSKRPGVRMLTLLIPAPTLTAADFSFAVYH